ncbi:hypothetical protein G195_010281 [Phytophthora kernoviae 00238/432]|uniref:PX domain-containing protein n=2 Tax=Phytophthora kernoviae TaxID=325452 RepID=A0A8T0M0C9_9STRA|nr:hypothetical protein G195_010281 [Phytophthora kernoviae 00238/432]KAG2525353.1 hypothetical protein JM16_004496 [Phytophthora kernoviae]
MQLIQSTSPTKMPFLSTTKASPTLWTARLVAALWKIAVDRARKMCRQAQGGTGHSNNLYSNIVDAPGPTSIGEVCEPFEADEASIMQEAARAVVASGVVSLADLEKITGFRFSNKDEASSIKDDDTNSEAATDTSDSCSIVDCDECEEDVKAASPRAKMIYALERSNVERVEINKTRTIEDNSLVYVLEVYLSLPPSRLPVNKPNSEKMFSTPRASRLTFHVERRFSDFEELRRNVSGCVSMERQCSCKYCLDFVEYIRFAGTQPRGLVKLFSGAEKRRQMLVTFTNDFLAMGQRRAQKRGRRKCEAQELVPKLLNEFLLHGAMY